MEIYEILKGEVRAELRGALPESFVNTAAKAGIELKNIERVDEISMLISFYERDTKRLESIARRCMCEIHTLRVRGGSRTAKLIKRRWLMLAFLLLSTALVYASTLFVWEIDIRGNETVSKGEILRALSGAGLDYGTYWPKLSVDIIRSEVICKLPDIGWMAVNVSGARANVRIIERKEKPEIYSPLDSADIVAAKTGIVRRVSALNGKALVGPGDAVTAGEILIGGTLDSICGQARFVRAKGSVLAETWYELSALTPEEELEKTKHGFAHNRFAIVMGKKRINLYPNYGKTIDEYDKIVHDYKLGIDGLFSMPMKIVREEYISYDSVPACLYDGAQMTQNLTNMLRESAAGEINSVSFSEGNFNGVHILTLRAHCTEEIGETVALRGYERTN